MILCALLQISQSDNTGNLLGDFLPFARGDFFRFGDFFARTGRGDFSFFAPSGDLISGIPLLYAFMRLPICKNKQSSCH